MKSIIKIVFFLALISHSVAMFSQQEVNFYKQMVEQCLSKGNCDKAQIMYESYKDAIGKADVDIETRIKACKEGGKPPSTTSNQEISPALLHAIESNGSTQTRTSKGIEGIVVDETGEPLIGASVVVKGTSTGTVTDMDGRFNLSYFHEKEVFTLTFSYVGYKKKNIFINDIYTTDMPLKVVMEKKTSLF